MWDDVRSYFGLDEAASTADWGYVVVDLATPMLFAFIIGGLDGVSGLSGWLLLVGYIVVCRSLWTPILHRAVVRSRDHAKPN
jgi:hypothetical protein